VAKGSRTSTSDEVEGVTRGDAEQRIATTSTSRETSPEQASEKKPTDKAGKPTEPTEPAKPRKPPVEVATTGATSKLTPGRRTDDNTPQQSKLAKSGQAVKKGSDVVRSRIASLVWLLCVLAAIILASGALLVALDANMQNDLVQAVIDTAEKLDGPFWRIFEFHTDTKGLGPGPRDATKEHLVNWGLAAVAYLVVGRVLDRIIRP
jgi:hypothetical protein